MVSGNDASIYVKNAEPSLDPRNADHPTSALIAPQPRRRKAWKAGVTLNQGTSYACTGFSWAAEMIALPQGDLTCTRADGEALGRMIYLDRSPSEPYGNAVNAGAQWQKDRGLVEGYAWPSNADELIDVILGGGPIVMGLPWYDSMDYPRDDDTMKVDFNGTPSRHQILGHGYDPMMKVRGFQKPQEVVLLRNTWGRWWGRDGSAWIRVKDLDVLLKAGPQGYLGNACYVYGRKPVDVSEILARG